MILLLTLLSLCATDCRVHRAYEIRDDGSMNIRIGCMYKLDDTGGAVGNCLQPSHWLPCVVVEKCDTILCPPVWFGRVVQVPGDRFVDVDGRTYILRDCHPETTLVDSGVVDDDWWFSSPGGKVGILKPVEDDTLWIFDTPFLRSEMPDLKAMLREWRVEKCYKAIVNRWDRWDIFEWEKDAVRDSCECAVEGAKK